MIRKTWWISIYALWLLMAWSSHAAVEMRGDAVTMRGDAQGPTSLKYEGVELLAGPHFYVGEPLLLDAAGKKVTLAGKGVATFDPAKLAWHYEAPWGAETCTFLPRGEVLDIRVQVVNRSAATIAGYDADLLELRFPQEPLGKAWEQHFQVRKDNVDDFTAVPVNYGAAQLVACNEEVARPLWFGFSTPVAAKTYRLQLSTRLWNAARDPAIPPGATREFHFTLRFAPTARPVGEITADLARALAAKFPYALAWKDRRPIGMIALASHYHQSAVNPRGWFDDPLLNVVDKQGAKRFRRALLERAKMHLSVLKAEGAQGIVLWNAEGEEWGNITYVGDPRMLPQLAPEMDAVADEYFALIRKAGFRTGVCIRPTRIIADPRGKNGPWMHYEDGVDAVAEMSAKIDYAQRRWGCTLFYIDTSVHYFRDRDEKVTTQLVSTAEWRRLAKLHPDVLLIPEFSSPASSSVCAPYRELRPHAFGNQAATPENVLAAYPQAFSIINPAEGPIQERRAELVAGVRHGDVLLFRAFFRDEPLNRPVREIYQEAMKPAAPQPQTITTPPRKVVLVHGLYDTARKMQPLAAYLRAQGFQTFTPTLAPSDGRVGLEVLAGQLREQIDAHFGPELPIQLVGFSMGGLVTRYYLQRLGGAARVKRYLTIAAPHHGSAWAWLLNHPGVRQMRPGSAFLSDLNEDAEMLAQHDFTSLWTPFDLMILPARSSQMKVGENLTLPVLLHPWMVWQKSSLALVAERLLR